MQKIVPNLWLDDKAEEAVAFYTTTFKNSKILKVTKYGQEGSKISGKKEGSVMTVNFLIETQEFVALNGGPEFKFNEAVSFIVNCTDQEEIDYFWDKFGKEGEEGVCGWIKDKFSLWWQIVPEGLDDMLLSEKAMKLFLGMKKIEIEELKRAR